MGAMRIARTVTGRSMIAIFTGAYHGIFDEVIVRGTRKLKSIPAAPGIMPIGVAERARARLRHAGVARDPAPARARARRGPRRAGAEPAPRLPAGRVPARAARAHRADAARVLIFDEVVTGFRAHPRGAQGLFGIQADLASYGKVVGGGFPIGVIAGKRAFMDALDGGHWQYGDDSIPTVGVTYFAGTFVRHPLALAAAQRRARSTCATPGPALQERLTATHRRDGRRDQRRTWPSSARRSSSTRSRRCGATCSPRTCRTATSSTRCCATAASTSSTTSRASSPRRTRDEDVATIVAAYKAAADEMQASGFFPARARRGARIAADGGRARGAVDRAAARGLARRPARPRGVARLQRVDLAAPARRARRRRAAPRRARAAAAPRRAARDVRRRRPHDARAGTAPELEVPLRDLEGLAPAARDAELAAIARAPRRRAVRPRARAAGARRARAPRRRSPRARVHRPPHRARRLVVLGARQGPRRALRHRHRRAQRAAAGRAVVRRLRRRQRRARGLRRARGQRALVGRAVRRRRARARPADRSAAPAGAHARPPAARITCCPPSSLAGVKKLGAEHRREPVRDAARRLRRAAPPADRSRPISSSASRPPARRRAASRAWSATA